MRVRYPTDPPTSGRHYQLPAEDGRYEEAPADTAVVHAFEHGRVGVWFNPALPERRRAALRALFEEDSYQLLIVPRPGMNAAVVAAAGGDANDRTPGLTLAAAPVQDVTLVGVARLFASRKHCHALGTSDCAGR